jgi:hypothetical protein
MCECSTGKEMDVYWRTCLKILPNYLTRDELKDFKELCHKYRGNPLRIYGFLQIKLEKVSEEYYGRINEIINGPYNPNSEILEDPKSYTKPSVPPSSDGPATNG